MADKGGAKAFEHEVQTEKYPKVATGFLRNS